MLTSSSTTDSALTFDVQLGKIARKAAAMVAIVAIALFLLAAAKPGLDFPITYDEAYNLSMAKHLADTGQYATEVYGTPLRWFDPKVTTGPTVLFPLALAIKLFGVQIAPLRIALLSFLILFLVSAYFSARRQSSWVGGCITVLLFGTLSYDLYDLGLRILGEVPSLAFLFVSVIALAKASARAYALSGAFLALALLTKPQMAIAVIAFFAVLIPLTSVDREKMAGRSLLFLLGFAVPLVAWNAYQVVSAGPQVWLNVSAASLNYLTGQSGLAKHLAERWPLIAAAVPLLLAIWAFTMAKTSSLRIHNLAINRLLARLTMLGFGCILVPVMHWELFFDRVSYHWRDHPVETALALGGIGCGVALGSYRLKPGILAISMTGVLFAEWYFGISEQGYYRYSIFWRAIGLVECAVAVAAIVSFFYARSLPLARSHCPRGYLSKFAARYGSVALGFAAIGLLISRNLSTMQSPMSEADRGATQAANWVMKNTPDNSIIFGSGWWLPWETEFLTGRTMADVNASVLNGIPDLQRPRFLVMYTHLDRVAEDSLPRDVANVRSRSDLLLFESEGTSVYRWPVSPFFPGSIQDIKAVKTDLLQSLRLGRMSLTPVPKDGILDQDHGDFRFPVVQSMLSGLTMISPATITTTKGIDVDPGDGLFFGYLPPSAGDGLLLSVYVNDGLATTKVWSEYVVQIPDKRPDRYRARLVPLADYAGKRVSLSIKVSSEPTGDAVSDWLFLSPLAIVKMK